MDFSTRTIIIALLFGLLAILANILASAMVKQINLKLSEEERIHFAGWGIGIGKKHREFYPQSKLRNLFLFCVIGLFICFPFILWSEGFFRAWFGGH
jgi:hypothetical protein